MTVMSKFRKFMVNNFLGLNGIKVATLGKNGEFKEAHTISWMKAGPRIFSVFVAYGIAKLINNGLFTFWDIPFLILIIFCIWGGFIYPRTNPLKIEEMNAVEKENHIL